MPPKLLDTHIHLWPSTATSPTDHAWMTPGLFLAKRHGVTDYRAATSASPVQPSGFVYVETDRYLPSAEPPIGADDGDDVRREKMKAWAQKPLEELSFLRRVADGKAVGGDGFEAQESGLLRGLVVWAPFHLPTPLFDLYLQIAREAVTDGIWREKVVGFRYLLQGKGAEAVKAVVESEEFAGNLRAISGTSFDVGIDCHADGVESLEYIANMVERIGATGDVNFVLNHFCKPDFSTPSWPSFPRYAAAISRIAAHPNTYMKLSGAFNEFAPSPTPNTAAEVLLKLRRYLEHILKVFGPKRIMFGSDWPVCNVGGPKGEDGNWGLWREVVQEWVSGVGLGEEEREWVWWKTGAKAYGLEDP